MSATQDGEITTAGANTASTPQGTSDTSTSPTHDRTSASQVSPAMDRDLSDADLDNLDQLLPQEIFPGSSFHDQIMNALESTFEDMMHYFQQENHEHARSVAGELLLPVWSNHLPVLYRAYAHIVLAYGPTNGLYHACLAVQDARWGMENFDDWSAAEELLAAANRTLRMLLGNSRVEDIQETTEEDGEGA